MKHYKQLSLSERYQIDALVKNKTSIPAIASALGRDPTSIRREVKKAGGFAGYGPIKAHQAAQSRRRSARKPYKMTPELSACISELIEEKWSPEQIAGRLASQGVCQIHRNTIYRFVYAQSELGNDLWKHLRTGRKKPKSRKKPKTQRELIPDKTPISLRPAVVDECSRLGDLEVDTIIGAHHKGAIVTIVDRKSQHLWIGQPHEKTADKVAKKICALLKAEKGRIHTICSDNGLEFARHAKVSKALQADYFFAQPYNTNQRARIEHANKLIRQYLPKSYDLRFVSAQECKRIVEKLNNRPRKQLGFKTPKEVFFGDP